MAELRTGDGRKLPPLLRAEIDRLRRRLALTLELIREMETERDEALTVTSGTARTQKVTALQRIRGLGPNFAAILVCEVPLPIVCQPPTTRQLRRHYTDALPKRRH